MDKHTKTCVFRPSRCEYCGAETTMNDIQVSKCRAKRACMAFMRIMQSAVRKTYYMDYIVYIFQSDN